MINHIRFDIRATAETRVQVTMLKRMLGGAGCLYQSTWIMPLMPSINAEDGAAKLRVLLEAVQGFTGMTGFTYWWSYRDGPRVHVAL